jgi:hypothetical protein
MTDNSDLLVEVRGGGIIITLPGTNFMVTYLQIEWAAARCKVRLDRRR